MLPASVQTTKGDGWSSSSSSAEENVGDGPFADFHMMNATLDYVRHGAYWSELFVGSHWDAIWWTAASFDSRRNKTVGRIFT